ncbi:MAG: hypothetical protein ACK4WH_13045, partial [Phycisphaerales bacterium]
MLPIPKRNPNSRGHWAVLAKKHAQDRRVAYLNGLAALNGKTAPRWAKARATITWHAGCDAHIPDADNAHARCKGYLDGLEDAGWYIDDKDVDPTIVRTPNKPRCVTIACEEIT